MINHEIPAHCGEIMEKREGVREQIRNAALFVVAMDSLANDEFYLHGQISEETAKRRSEAGKNYNAAIGGMLGNNSELRATI